MNPNETNETRGAAYGTAITLQCLIRVLVDNNVLDAPMLAKALEMSLKLPTAKGATRKMVEEMRKFVLDLRE